MDYPARDPEEMTGDKAAEDPNEDDLDAGADRDPSDTSETEMTGSADPGTVATPEGTPEVSESDPVPSRTDIDEELEDRGDV